LNVSISFCAVQNSDFSIMYVLCIICIEYDSSVVMYGTEVQLICRISITFYWTDLNLTLTARFKLIANKIYIVYNVMAGLLWPGESAHAPK
jgi:hypothetical protein